MTDPRRPIESLDDLFADAAAAERRFPTMRAGKPEAPKKLTFNEKYLLPENWTAKRGVALIHEETKTLLGNFQELVHKREAGCRRLVRVEEPIVIDHTEYVRGPEWLGVERERIQFEPQRWTSERELLLADLALHPLGVHAADVLVRVCLYMGGMARIELIAHTTFMSVDAHSIITIPAGVNVIEAMSLDAKIEVRKELSA